MKCYILYRNISQKIVEKKYNIIKVAIIYIYIYKTCVLKNLLWYSNH